MKTCAAFNVQDGDDIHSLVQNQNASPIEFSAQPSEIKVGPNSQSILNVTAKFKNSF